MAKERQCCYYMAVMAPSTLPLRGNEMFSLLVNENQNINSY